MNFIYSLLLDGSTFSQINYDSYDRIDVIRQYLKQVELRFNNYLINVTTTALSREISRTQRDSSIIFHTVEVILIHELQEEIHHIVEFIALLWQIDVSPPQ